MSSLGRLLFVSRSTNPDLADITKSGSRKQIMLPLTLVPPGPLHWTGYYTLSESWERDTEAGWLNAVRRCAAPSRRRSRGRSLSSDAGARYARAVTRAPRMTRMRTNREGMPWSVSERVVYECGRQLCRDSDIDCRLMPLGITEACRKD